MGFTLQFLLVPSALYWAEWIVIQVAGPFIVNISIDTYFDRKHEPKSSNPTTTHDCFFWIESVLC